MSLGCANRNMHREEICCFREGFTRVNSLGKLASPDLVICKLDRDIATLPESEPE